MSPADNLAYRLASSAKSTYPEPGPPGETDAGPWPQGVSRQPEYSIGKVVELIKGEFPTLTVSKLRYLEDQGIVNPDRSSSGYRKYSRADLARIKYCLSAQRDSYLPIREIYAQLQAMDAGEKPAGVPVPARLVAKEGQLLSDQSPTGKVTVRELLDLSGADRKELEHLVAAGLITADLSNRFPAHAVQIVRLAAALERIGVNVLQLRFLATTAHRASDLVDRSVSPGINLKSGPGKEKRHAQLEEGSHLLSELFTQLLRVSVEEIS